MPGMRLCTARSLHHLILMAHLQTRYSLISQRKLTVKCTRWATYTPVCFGLWCCLLISFWFFLLYYVFDQFSKNYKIFEVKNLSAFSPLYSPTHSSILDPYSFIHSLNIHLSDVRDTAVNKTKKLS